MLAAVQPSPWLRPAKMHLINVHQHQMASRDDKPHTALRLNKRGSNRQRFQKEKRRTGTAGKNQNKHPKRKQNNRRGGTTEQTTQNSSYTRPICGQMHNFFRPSPSRLSPGRNTVFVSVERIVQHLASSPLGSLKREHGPLHSPNIVQVRWRPHEENTTKTNKNTKTLNPTKAKPNSNTKQKITPA